ncbi:MAG: MFS transporter [Candidatus Diapherotrites archaeon]|nr:MFS transporter [Candidatus Diapherotrites archaeon]
MQHSITVFLGQVRTDLKNTPKTTAQLLLGLFLYYLAWGLIDPFLSIYIEHIVSSYSFVGLIFGTLFLIGILINIPLGSLADKINKIQAIAGVLLFYVPISLLYFFSGMFNGMLAIALLIFARILHGFGLSYKIFVESFLRKNSVPKHTAGSFGLYFTTQFTARLIGILIALILITSLGLTIENLHWFFLGIIPCSILAFIIIRKIPDDGKKLNEGMKEMIEKEKIVAQEIKDFTEMGFPGSVMILSAFFYIILHLLIWVYLPLYALKVNVGLPQIALMYVFISIPYAGSFLFAELADFLGKKKTAMIALFFAAIILARLSILTTDGFEFLFLGFLLAVVVSFLGPSLNGIITDITPKSKGGEITGIINSVVKTSELVGVIGLGILLDLIGFKESFRIIAALLILMAILFLLARKSFEIRTANTSKIDTIL